MALCVVGFTIETIRALHGHTFSWLYVFEWPILAGFGIYMWWMLFTDRDRQPRPSERAARRADRRAARDAAGTAGTAPTTAAPDEDLAAWQRYLQKMEADEAADPDRPR